MNSLSVSIDFLLALARKGSECRVGYVTKLANFDFAKRSAVKEPVKVHKKGGVLVFRIYSLRKQIYPNLGCALCSVFVTNKIMSQDLKKHTNLQKHDSHLVLEAVECALRQQQSVP